MFWLSSLFLGQIAACKTHTVCAYTFTDACVSDCSVNPFYEARLKRLQRKARPLGNAQINLKDNKQKVTGKKKKVPLYTIYKGAFFNLIYRLVSETPFWRPYLRITHRKPLL